MKNDKSVFSDERNAIAFQLLNSLLSGGAAKGMYSSSGIVKDAYKIADKFIAEASLIAS